MMPGISTPISQNASCLHADILSDIFLLCVPPEGGTFLLKESPWKLGQVCRHWRYIVLNTPLLWDRLKINTRDGRNISRACGILVECLRRAADNKLQLSITADVAYEYYDCQPLYDLVLDRCEDWESLKLVIFGQVPPIIPPPGAKLSSLRRFEIRPQLLGVLRASGTDTGILKSLMQTVQRAPSVEYACFDGTSLIDRHMLSGAIPGTAWVNLRTLELHTYEGADLISVLSNCSSRLERLILAELNVAIPVDGDVVEFPVLKTLKLKRFAPYWLRRLSLPRLEHLVLTYLDIQRDTSPLFDMVQRQGFSIRSVSFIDIVFMDVTVERFLRLTPHATTLTVTGTVFPYIFDRIALDKNILPHLTTLVVRPSTWMDNRIISPPLATILRVVVSRLDTLKVVKVEALLRPCETEVVEQIRSLHRHGILVEVKVLPVKDGEYLEVPEIILLMSGAMIFTPLFGSKPTIRNPEEMYLLLGYLLDRLEDEDHYSPSIVKRYYSEHLAPLSLLPHGGQYNIRERANKLFEKWKKIRSC